MHKHLNLLFLATENLLRHRTKTVVVCLCIIAILTPFITAIAISEGIRAQSLNSVNAGADLYLTSDEFGRNAAISLKYLDEIKKIFGVTKVVPRIVGRGFLQNKLTVIVGIHKEDIPEPVTCISGRVFENTNEVVVGHELAKYFHLNIGDQFSMRCQQRKVFTVVGIFSADSGIWGASMIFMPFNDAGALFGKENVATDIQIYSLPGHNSEIATDLYDIFQNEAYRLQDKQMIELYVKKGFMLKEGVFSALYIVAIALGVPAILVTSGFGLSERKKEIGIMKATGWQTLEVLELISFEQFLISLLGATIAIVLAILWVGGFRGAFIAQFFIAEITMLPKFALPARFLPLPCFISFFFAFLLTMVGSIYSSWRASTVSPVVSMQS
ncbi:MAG: ABC transporter permease [Candidatus Brocadiaceae bacterium]|jgi:ABC-type lipoprotein release transport system permease subunit|nr:ABC transporter permease [Candidatus Brocadiaceae bacterium]